METWASRRSPVIGNQGICSSSQPLATAAGVRILQNGGNAADAAVAMAAVLNLTEPCSTGIGGDAFALYFEASTKKVHCLEGNGESPAGLTMEALKERGYGVGEGLKGLNPYSGLCVSVPGAALLWEDLVKRFGSCSCSLAEILSPAIKLAEDGFPVSPVTAQQWKDGKLQGEEANRVLRPGGKSPLAGQIFRNPDLAATFRSIAEKGTVEGFYKGRIAEAMIEAVKEIGGVMELSDLAYYTTKARDPAAPCAAEPISAVYKGKRVYEVGPPTSGLAALLGLLLVQEYESIHGISNNPAEAPSTIPAAAAIAGNTSNSNSSSNSNSEEPAGFTEEFMTARSSVENTHLSVECMRIAYSEALHHICDTATEVEVSGEMSEKSSSELTYAKAHKLLLDEKFIRQRAMEISAESAIKDLSPTQIADLSPFLQSETVYFSCVDQFGNACSMINSNYMGFGTGKMPKGVGFTLQNRAHNFSLVPGHANQVGPRKRPYHTIIPALLTNESDGSLFAVVGNMGGFMQPLGHFQLIRNIVDFKLDPQAAIDAPRWYLGGVPPVQCSSLVAASIVHLEDGYQRQQEGVVEGLRAKGHEVVDIVRGYERNLFGRGQIIMPDPTAPQSGVCWAGSDPRCDGCAMPAVIL